MNIVWSKVNESMETDLSKLPAPIKVSPLIKLCRYSLLIAGIFYGATKRKALEMLEASRKEEKARLKAERDAMLAEERRAASERDIQQIVALFSEKPSPIYTVQEQSYQNVKINGGDSQDNINVIEETTRTCTPLKSDEMQNVKSLTGDNNKDDASVDDEGCKLFTQPLDMRSEKTDDVPKMEMEVIPK